MSSKALLPTAYLAPISYYAILLKLDCTIEHYEYFVKQSIRNRCNIYAANGKLRLTIPKQHKGSSKTTINKIKISYNETWQKEHWRSIVSAYNSSPFFEYYKDLFRPFFEVKDVYLISFNAKLQELILKLLQVKIKCQSSNKYLDTGQFKDLRNHTFSKKKIPKYNQVFLEKHGFISDLSILDLLFNLGPESTEYLNNIDISITRET